MSTAERERAELALLDNDRHSVRSDIWAQLKADTTEKVPRATQALAEVRQELDEAEYRLVRVFQRYEKTRGLLEEAGVLAQMKLSPVLEAAHGSWLRSRDVPKRIELSELPEAPLPPEGE